MAAAIEQSKAGIEVAVFYHDFKDEDEAFDYAVANQRDRRNLTDADIVRLVEKCDQRKKSGKRTDLAPCGARSEKTAVHTADIIGVNHRKVERARAIIDHADQQVEGKLAVDFPGLILDESWMNPGSNLHN